MTKTKWNEIKRMPFRYEWGIDWKRLYGKQKCNTNLRHLKIKTLYWDIKSNEKYSWNWKIHYTSIEHAPIPATDKRGTCAHRFVRWMRSYYRDFNQQSTWSKMHFAVVCGKFNEMKFQHILLCFNVKLHGRIFWYKRSFSRKKPMIVTFVLFLEFSDMENISLTFSQFKYVLFYFCTCVRVAYVIKIYILLCIAQKDVQTHNHKVVRWVVIRSVMLNKL